MTTNPALPDALRAALAVEHETVYGYGALVAHLSGHDRHVATAALHEHQRRRDTLTSLVSGAGATASPALPAYALPAAVRSPAAARALAAQLENSGAGAAWDVVAASAAGSAARRLAVSWLTDAALRAATWGSPRSLPGEPG